LSPPSALPLLLTSSYGDYSLSPRPPRRSSDHSSAAAGPSSLAAVFGTRGTAISPPMAMTCHLASTYGDDSGFRRHLWPSFSSCIAEAAQTSLAAVFGTRGTVISQIGSASCRVASAYWQLAGFPASRWAIAASTVHRSSRALQTRRTRRSRPYLGFSARSFLHPWR